MARNKTNTPDSKLEAAKEAANKKSYSFFEAVESLFVRIFRWFSGIIDKIFFSTKYLYLFALALAVLMYFSVQAGTEANLISSLSSAKNMNNLRVQARYNSESFEVSGLPDSCNVVLTGIAANVNSAATKDGYCLLNLEGLTEGTHKVSLSATGFGDSVTTVVTPSEATVTLKKKTTGQFDLSYDFINSNKMDSRYILGTPVFATGNSKINIRASQDTLNTISLVKALIDVSGISGDFSIEAPIVAYDKNGKVVQAEIVPSTVTADVKVSSPNKSVPISLKLSGTAPVGYSIESVSMDHQSANIYASQAVLDSVEEVYVNLDLSTINGSTELSLSLSLPNGVSAADVTMVNVKVTLAETESKIITGVPIVYLNNTNGYGASAIETTTVDVTVSGSAAVINSITKDNFVVYIDVGGIEPGEYTLPLQIATASSASFTDIVNNAGSKYAVFTLSQPEIKITLVES